MNLFADAVFSMRGFQWLVEWIDGLFRDHRLEEAGKPDWRKCLFFFPILAPALCLLLGPQYLDDAMITFRVSRNLVDFGVPYYNVGEVAQASTTPFYSLLLAAGYAVTGFAPDVFEAFLQIPFLIMTLVLLSLISLQIESLRPYWWLAGFFFSFHPILIVHVKGMEAYCYGVFILLAVFAELKRKPVLLGAALGLCAVTRTEGALFAVAYMIYWAVQRYWFQEKRSFKELALSTGVGLATGLPFLIYVVTFFGDPIPTSVRGKAHQASFVRLEHFDDTMKYYLVGQYPTFNLWFIPLTAFALLILPRILRTRNAAQWREFGFLSLAGYGLMLLFYSANAPAFAWYLYPSIVLFTVIYAYCMVVFCRHLTVLLTDFDLAKNARLLYTIPMIPILLYGFTLRTVANVILLNYVRKGDYAFMSDVRYGEVGRMLKAEYPESTHTLGAPEIGHLGYRTGFEIIDFSALASPALLEDAGRLSYYEMALKHDPDFVVIPEDAEALERVPGLKKRFSAAYPYRTVIDAAHLGTRTVYRKSAFPPKERVAITNKSPL